MKVFIVLLACLTATSLANTAGRRFQLVFLENIVEAPKDLPLEVHVSNAGSTTATVTVSSPLTTCPSVTRNVGPNSSLKFEVCWWMRLVAADYWPSYKTVLVESNQDVMVYAFNKELFSADGYYAIPTNELAFTYYVAAIDEANIATQFAISATTETDIQISLPDDDALPVEVNYQGMRFTNGDTYSVRLTEYETYLAQSRGDLTGARITANQPIAVFSGNIRNKADSGSRDHLVAQLQPTGDFGTVFAIQPVPRNTNYGDIVRVIARRSSTTVTLTQTTTSSTQFLQNPGDFYQFQAGGATVINSDKDIEVVQMVRSQSAPRIADVADPAMFLVVPRSQWLNKYISPELTSAQSLNNDVNYDKNMVFLAIQSGNQNGLRLNGNTINPTWTTIGNIASTWMDISGARSNVFTHVNGVNFGAAVYGATDRESYAFFLGADLSASSPVVPGVIAAPIPTPDPGVPYTCQESLMTKGDQRDNDCDNRADEEECNSIDDDGDGLVDEDCEAGTIEAFGNSYVIMFMENNVDDNPNAQSFLEIYLSAVDSTATVQYSLSNEVGTFNRTIQPGQVDIFTDLPLTLRQIGSGIQNKAIRIIADGDVVVYGINKQTWSTDGFLAFPTDVIGQEYYTSHYYPGTDLNEFSIAATAMDGPTQITVTMPTNTVGGNIASSANFNGDVIGAGQSRTFSLDARNRETAQFQAASADMNLNGAHIIADKPIAVFSGNVRARVDPTTANSRDHLVHQLAPVDTWGNNFMTVPIPRVDDRGDIFTITASTGNTIITITRYDSNGNQQGSVENVNLNGGGATHSFDVSSRGFAHIESNRPVQLFQYVKTTASKDTDNADPAMMLVPPIEQWSRNYQFNTPRTGQDDGNGDFLPFETFVMITIDSNQRNGLRLDGNTLNPTWTNMAGTGFSSATVPVTFGRHSLSHIDDAVYFQALMYGRADRESYALPLGMRLVAKTCTITTMSEADLIDNDCDGSIDEELCNGIDDDADGQTDEDCGAGLSSGTSFYLTYMDNVVEYPKDLDLELYVAVVGTQSATVSVRAPLIDFPSYNTMSEVKPGDVQGYGFSWRLRNQGQGITNNVIFVRVNNKPGANADVVVYGINKEKFSNDGFLVYPENTLGSTYYTVSWAPSTLQTEFAVAATADNTQVTISTPNNAANIGVEANGQTYGAGRSFSVTLNRFQAYQAQSDGDLSGTRVVCSQRCAVFSGNVRTRVELSASRDHLVQQMIDTSKYATGFHVVSFPDRTVGDVLKIVAAEANTNVFVNNNQIGSIASAGGFMEYQLGSNRGVSLTSNRPIMVVQFVKSQDGRDNPEEADPAMFLVPSEQNYVTTATFITPVYSGGRVAGADYRNYLTMVIQNGQQGNVRLNGSPLANAQVDWQSVGNTGFVTGTFDVPSGRSHTLTTTSNAAFYGRLYGRADRESYAFPVGMSF